MHSTNFITRKGIFALFALMVISSLAFGQNFVLTTNTKINGTGTIKVAGNIDNSLSTKVDTVRNMVSLTGAAQSIGGGSSAIHFGGLEPNTAGNKTLTVDARVLDSLNIANGTLVVNGKTLQVDSGANHSGTGALNATSGIVIYANTTSTYTQSIVDATYATLTLSGNGKKNIGLNAVTVNTALSHSGGNLTVNKNLTAVAAYGFATIDSIGSNSTVSLPAVAGTIANINDIKSGSTLLKNGANTLNISGNIADNHGTITNGTGALTVGGTLSDNHGTISAATNNGAMTFANVTNNHGNITGGNGAVTFSSFSVNNGNITGGAGAVTFNLAAPLNDSAGTIQSGSGDMTFNGQVNIGGAGIIQSTAGTDSIRFAGVVNVNSGGTLRLTNNGTASLGGALNKNGTGALTFAAASRITYDGTRQSVAPATYGNLVLAGSDTAQGDKGTFTVQDSVTLNQVLAMGTPDTMVLASASANANVLGSKYATGAVRRSTMNAGTYYAFNKDSVGFKADQALSNITMNMRPDSIFSDSAGFTTYAKRYFGVGGTFGTANVTELSLVYASTEVVPSGAFTSQFGIRSLVGTTWSKVFNPAGYTRSVDSATGVVHLTGTLSALNGVSEFAIMKNVKEAKQTGNWTAGATWDDGVAPLSTDDVEIGRNATVSVDAASTANSLTILASPLGTLNVSGANLTVNGTVDLRGTLSVSNTRTLTIIGGTFRADGTLTNNGTIDIK